VDRLSAFFDIIHQDPVISQVKLIAEPWDIGEGGYQVGKFPAQWSEWNGKYRDTVRDYWRGQNRTLGEFANRFAGSSDLYQYTGRRPHASINFVTAHDGFTLDDLVSYDHKHNLANGEDNRDGSDDNRSWNCGAEGPTDNPGIIALRNRQKRNFIATLLLSQGTPMVLHGDEIGRTSGGNNNSYCQDNELNWLDWEHIDEELMGFVAHMIRLRRLHPTFRRNRWFHGRRICRNGMKDITWYRTDGREMSGDDWRTDYAKALAVGLCGDLDVLDARGQPVDDDDFLILFNAAHIPLPFRLPPRRDGGMWLKIVDTTVPRLKDEEQVYRPEHGLQVEGRSMVVLQYYQDV
jgi:glycogen operon protein